ncbi:hypothetical protein IWT25_00678 [Secundilactobacillus pentosiphilus]|uniref:Uncharacterized protein n=1 Tax=Secundilactobacillus pentosiphilus TaxID=1714682 RepID=A0A1Z5IUD6_9LACO|nr:hypothetical protein [Secundilactobacillus pentosiphilus]GAX05374.1 hypothetical protein IWT25_00678 [Secundilactobacillus pentosiphilus]
MAKLNNATNVLFSALILNGKASIDDVPDKLKEGVQAELDFFNDIDIASVGEPAPVSSDFSAPVEPTTVKPDDSEDTDKAVSDINSAVKDAE